MRGPKLIPVAQKKPNIEVLKQRKATANTASKKEKSSKKNTTTTTLKRPAGAFFIFMGEFRKTFKEEHPDKKSITDVGKAGGEKWKSMLDSEKAPYLAKAAKLKAEYQKAKEALNQKLQKPGCEQDTMQPEGSNISISATHDDDGEVSG